MSAILLLVALASAAPSPPPDDTRVLVLDLKAAGVDEQVAKQATEAVAEAVARVGGHKVMTLGELKALTSLEKQKEILGCDADAACFAEITKSANAELVVTGSVGLVGGETTLSLSLLEPEKANVKSRVTTTIDKVENLRERAQSLVAELFGAKLEGAVRFALPRGQASSFAVFDLQAAGVDPAVATNCTQLLAAEVKRIDGATVLGRDDVNAMLQLEKDKRVLGCSDDTQCLAELGGALGVERLVVGTVGKLAESYVISLRLVSTKKVVVENRITESFQGGEGELVRAIRHAGRVLLGVDASTPGSIAPGSTVEGAVVFVDGREVGKLPMPPVEGLAPGRHPVRIKADRHLDWVGDVYVNPGEATPLFVELQRRPDEWYESWVFWTAVAGAGTVAVASVAAGAGYLIWDQNFRTFPLSVKAGIPADRGTP